MAMKKLFVLMYQDDGNGIFEQKKDQIVKGVDNALIQVDFNVLSESELNK